MELIPNLMLKMQQDIISGVFNDVLPPIRLLAQHYNVGESTMKLSLKHLKENGFLIGQQGKCISVNPLSINNHFFQKNIIVYIKLPRLGLRLYTSIIESLRETFETNGAYVHLINSISQLKSRKIDADIIIAAKTKGEDMQYITDNYSSEKIILLNGYLDKYANVGTDNFQAGFAAIKYLHQEKKHTVIGILSMYLNYDLSFNKFRRDGAIEYSKQHPEVKLLEVDTEHFASNEEAVDYLLTSKNQITAIFATMDTLAFSVFFICSKE
jgi:DNA-binding LacI/PurR family transcriptional regulator